MEENIQTGLLIKAATYLVLFFPGTTEVTVVPMADFDKCKIESERLVQAYREGSEEAVFPLLIVWKAALQNEPSAKSTSWA